MCQGLLVLPNTGCENSYNRAVKEKIGENAKNVTCMPVNPDLAFMEMISEACSWEDGDWSESNWEGVDEIVGIVLSFISR